MSDFTNAGCLWALCSIAIAAVIAQTIVFVRKGWKASLEAGVSKTTLRKVVTSTALVTIVPTIPTIIVLYSLAPVLGQPLPWFRLSVIGSPGYESGVAAYTLSSLGAKMSPGGFDVTQFASVIAVATIASLVTVSLVTIFVKPVSMGFNKIKKSSTVLFSLIGVCCLTALIASMACEYGLRNWPGFWVTAGSFLGAFGTIKLSNALKEKHPKAKLLKDFNLPAGILVGLIVAYFVGPLFA